MTDHPFTYRVTWSAEDGEYVGLCAEFPSLSWLAATETAALRGIRKVVAQTVEDLRQSGEEVPEAAARRDARDLAIIDANAERLNAEALDALDCQAAPPAA